MDGNDSKKTTLVRVTANNSMEDFIDSNDI